jgi:hypothetical protein
LFVGGGFVPGLSQRASLPPPIANLSAVQSLSAAASGLALNLAGPPTVVGQANGLTTLRAPSVSLRDIVTSLHYVAIPGNDVALSWNLTVLPPNTPHWYNVSVDAATGQLRNVIDYANHASYEVVATPGENPQAAPRSVDVDPNIFNPTPAIVPSPFGWHDTNGASGAEFTITRGNNVSAAVDRDGDFVADTNSQPDGGAGLNFAGAELREGVEQLAEQHRVLEHQGAQRREVLSPAALHQVGRDRERRAREADQARAAREARLHEPQRGRHLGRDLGTVGHAQRADRGGVPQRAFDHGPRVEAHVDAQRRDRAHQVGEHDRTVEREARDGLQGDLGGELRRGAQLLEAVLGAQRAVLRQVTPGLAHDPDRSVVGLLALAGLQKFGAHGFSNVEENWFVGITAPLLPLSLATSYKL